LGRPRRSAVPAFEAFGGGSALPSRRSGRRRLGYLGLRVTNRLVPKRRDKVVLHSTIDVEDGILAVLEELAARGRTATVLLEDMERADRLRAMADRPVHLVAKRSLGGLRHFLTARYVMTTERVFGEGTPPASQVLVNLWHGEPPTKVTGLFSPGQDGVPGTYAPVCSTVGRAYRAAEFGIHPLQAPVIGAPRNDRMRHADPARMRRELLGDDAELTTFFWLPSFRVGAWGTRRRADASDHTPGLPFSPEDLHRLDDWLVEHGARVVVKLHPHDVEAFAGDFAAIRVLTQDDMEARGLTLYPLLPVFDALITDASSVWVDYLLTGQPMIFAFPDVDRYRNGRGLNLAPYEDWVPGPFCVDVEGLIGAMRDVVEGRDSMAQERTVAARRFHQFQDHGSTARLLDGLGITAR
jgi:CDP-glycerol glycerophosphotransferase (TagB/SpsB family)